MSARTRRFARWSAIGSLLLGMAGQVAYHLLTQSGATHAPWGITTAVSCLPVLVLGMGAALAHLLRADAHDPAGSGVAEHLADAATRDHTAEVITSERLTQAVAVAARLCADGRHISRRTLRAGGVRGSNPDLGTLARIITAQPPAKEPGTLPQPPLFPER